MPFFGLLKAAEEQQLREEFEREGRNLPPKQQSQTFDSNIITPGTQFMGVLSIALQYYVHLRLNSDPGWKNVKVFSWQAPNFCWFLMRIVYIFSWVCLNDDCSSVCWKVYLFWRLSSLMQMFQEKGNTRLCRTSVSKEIFLVMIQIHATAYMVWYISFFHLSSKNIHFNFFTFSRNTKLLWSSFICSNSGTSGRMLIWLCWPWLLMKFIFQSSVRFVSNVSPSNSSKSNVFKGYFFLFSSWYFGLYDFYLSDCIYPWTARQVLLVWSGWSFSSKLWRKGEEEGWWVWRERW